MNRNRREEIRRWDGEEALIVNERDIYASAIDPNLILIAIPSDGFYLIPARSWQPRTQVLATRTNFRVQVEMLQNLAIQVGQAPEPFRRRRLNEDEDQPPPRPVAIAPAVIPVAINEESTDAEVLAYFNQNLRRADFDENSDEYEPWTNVGRALLLGTIQKLKNSATAESVQALRILTELLRSRNHANNEYVYEIFKFFLTINNEINNDEENEFDFKVWRSRFHSLVVNGLASPLITPDIQAEFNNHKDIIMFRMGSNHCLACINILTNLYVKPEWKDNTIYWLTNGIFDNVGLKQNPGDDSEIAVPNAEYTAEYQEYLGILAVMFLACRAIWSQNLKITDVLRSTRNYYRKERNGATFIEAFPYLITRTDDENVHREANLEYIADSIYAYFEAYFEYVLIRLDCKIYLKRVVFKDADDRRIDDLDEGHWVVWINPLHLLPVPDEEEKEMDLEDSDEDDDNLFLPSNRAQRQRIRATQTDYVQQRDDIYDTLKRRNYGEGRQELNLEAVEAAAAAFERLIPDLRRAFKAISKEDFRKWIEDQINFQLERNNDNYKDLYLTEGDVWSGLMVSKFNVNAEFAKNMQPGGPGEGYGAPAPMERRLPVHCIEGLRHGYLMLTICQDLVKSLGSMCLYQAYFVAKFHHRFVKGDILYSRKERRARMLEEFRRLPPQYQEIFITGDILKFREIIQDESIVTIIFEVDDFAAVLEESDHLNSTPIACFDGHAVCSSWEKIERWFKEVMEKDKAEEEDHNGHTVSCREGKKIRPLKKLSKKERKPKKNYFMDIETYDKIDIYGKSVMVPYMVVVIHGKEEHDTTPQEDDKIWFGTDCKEQFLMWLESKLPKIKNEGETEEEFNIWGFNAYNFDFIFFIRELIHWEGCDLKGSLTNIKTLSIRGVKFLDYYRISNNGSLAKQAKLWGVGPKMDFDHTIVNEDWLENISLEDFTKCVEYCVNDCRVLRDIVLKYIKYVIEQKDVSPYHYSGAGLAFATWRRSLNYKFDIQGVPLWLYPIVQQSYKGGMVQLIKKKILPGQTVKLFDINSSYPAAMMGEIPCKFKDIVHWNTNPQLEDMNPKRLVKTNLYEVVDFEWKHDTYVPTLPTRGEEGLRYELKANIVEYIWGTELIAYIETKKILKGYISREIRFTTAKIFEDFVKKLYAQRLKAKASKDEITSEFCKLQLNSTYGKTAQLLYPTIKYLSEDKAIYYLMLNAKELILAKTEQVGYNLWKVVMAAKRYKDQLGGNVHIASFVTAEARRKLIKVIDKDAVYMDTDSYATTGDIPDELKDANKLGGWKLEDEFTEWIGVANKVYAGLRVEKDWKRPDGSIQPWKMRFKGVAKTRYDNELKKIVPCFTPETFKELREKGQLKLPSGVIWKRSIEGYVHKINSNKVICPNDKRVFNIDGTNSTPKEGGI